MTKVMFQDQRSNKVQRPSLLGMCWAVAVDQRHGRLPTCKAWALLGAHTCEKHRYLELEAKNEALGSPDHGVLCN